MPRVNIYLPNDVYELAERWRDSASLSEICARAIKDEFDAREVHRAPPSLLDAMRQPNAVELELMQAYGLTEALIADTPTSPLAIREILGGVAAKYLDQNVCDGSLIAVAGGRQMWCVVRQLSPRRVRSVITALGLHHTDPKLLHLHPNTLATFIWLLYSPRSEAHIIGAGDPTTVWSNELPHRDHPSYFVVSSCGSFDAHSSFAKLMGNKNSDELIRRDVVGDFAYAFIGKTGGALSVSIDLPQFTLSADTLETLAKRDDARILMVAGGAEKIEVIRKVLQARLCNVLITDGGTANRLLSDVEACSHVTRRRTSLPRTGSDRR